MTLYALLITPLAAAAISALLSRTRKSVLEYTAIAAAAFELVLALLITSNVLAEGTLHAPDFLQADALGAFVICFIALVGLTATIHSVGHLREEMEKGIIGFRRLRQYFVLFHLFFFAMFAAALSASPVLMWVTVEATTLTSAFLITFYNKPSALEAGWKFLIINSVGLLLGFLGTLLFLSAAAGAGAPGAFVTWTVLQSLAASLDPTLIKVAFVFVFIGFGTKVGLVPMHTWLPDAHSNAPIPISSLLSGVLLNIALVGILRFRTVADASVDPSFSRELLIVFGIASLIVAAAIIYVQRNYKRLLAYSSIEHMGFMAIGFALGGVATVAALFHMLYHALLKSMLFFAAGNFFLKYGSTKITEVRGALSTMPFSAIAFFGGILAITGIPPSGMFFTELTILSETVRIAPAIAFIALAALLVVFAGFLRHASAMIFSPAPAGIAKGETSHFTRVSVGLLLAVFILLSFYVPQHLSDLIAAAAAIIG
ncbi:hypothetical protein A2853_01915 [Candidatus Kaiserbacteria bacterium RIFCSPHIGHO2_01_FULL_55_17]|uniref:NADH:quinone oxidoreductase/Mrp antiporter transmembrane domain-containing protein n=1 Tax=Candidatus Kaiserbacteria bacterium RIFCSPHIGHO2_01_FULL_55_17 TaxID=1798484 RepID=A0A1F6D831_9BACT|nr:MAG: hypothetical protein A2853_01915 [Candidatus Kaiserbacteria bacterium RIFCSPHIGHO2_01_FULL_55_17]